MTATPPEPGIPHTVDPVPRIARPYQGHRAGVVTRTVAGTVDYALVTVAVLGSYVGVSLLIFVSRPVDFTWPQWKLVYFLALGWFYLFVYLTVGWATTGRTVGGRIMGLRVVNFRGERMTLVGAALRSAFCTVFPVGLFWAAVSRANRSVQDVVLRTSVVHDWYARAGRVTVADED